MRSLLLPSLLLALAAPGLGQFVSARALISSTDSVAVPAIPNAGLWAEQHFVGTGNEFLRTEDGGFLQSVDFTFVRWDGEQRAYRGLLGGEALYRVLPLGETRLLIERDLTAERRTHVTLAEWRGAELHLFDLELEAGSRFLRHLEQAGARVTPGDPNEGIFGTAAVVDGDPARLRAALRSWTFGEHDLDGRLRRPKHAEMATVWNYFELVNWVEAQRRTLRQIDRNMDQIQRLGDLHAARHAARYAYDARLDEFASFELDPYQFGKLGEYGFEQYTKYAKRIVDTLGERTERRMEWLATEIEVLSHEVAESENGWGSPSPWAGQLLRMHLVVRDAGGAVLDDTRQREEPLEAHLAGDLPEGIQYALRTMAFGDVIMVRVPPGLAFGSQHGVVDIEIELLDSVRVPSWRPPLEGVLGYRLSAVDATELASGLRYRDLQPGTGATPKRGDDVELRYKSWNARGDELEAGRTVATRLGGDELMPGLNEGLASMQVGGQRVLFVPRHLAEQDPARRGMAQCVLVELMSCKAPGPAGAPR